MSRQIIIYKKRAARNTEVSIIQHSCRLFHSIFTHFAWVLHSIKTTLETLNNIGFKSTVYNAEDKEYCEQNYPRKQIQQQHNYQRKSAGSLKRKIEAKNMSKPCYNYYIEAR